jgi:N-acetylglucosaminyl-diphospho-decaprenol L-rhamnosyltransferase
MSKLDVVVVAYGSRDAIASCVDAAGSLDGVGQVVVVDHGDDGSAGRARAAGARVIADPSNPGFGAGQNHGVAETDAPFVLLVNPDAVLDADGVAAGLALLERDPSIGAVQGVIVDEESGGPQRSQGRELGPLHLLGRALGARRLLRSRAVRRLARLVRPFQDHVDRVPASATPVEALAATALLVRRAAFVDVGGFDEGYFCYGEDLDLCRRLRAAGWRLVALPDRFAVHAGGGSFDSVPSRELSWWGGTMRFAARWWSAPAWGVALGAASLEWLRLSVPAPSRARGAWAALVALPRRERRTRPR